MTSKHIELITNITTSRQCPLNCSYCVMDFKDNISAEVISLKSNKLLDRIITFVNFLIKRGYTIEMGQSNGEPLLNFKKVKYIIDNLKTTNGISYGILSSFAFDSRNNHKAVIDLCNRYIELFTDNNIKFTLRWSVHLEYFDNINHIIRHYNMIVNNVGNTIKPIVMLNKVKDVYTYFLLKKVIPDTTYHLILDNNGDTPLLSKLSPNQIDILKKSNDYIKGKHIIDRILNNNFSFTGTRCHLPPLLNIVEDGSVFNCPNSYHNFYKDEAKPLRTVFDLTDEQILDYANPPICLFANCNVCASDPSLL